MNARNFGSVSLKAKELVVLDRAFLRGLTAISRTLLPCDFQSTRLFSTSAKSLESALREPAGRPRWKSQTVSIRRQPAAKLACVFCLEETRNTGKNACATGDPAGMRLKKRTSDYSRLTPSVVFSNL